MVGISTYRSESLVTDSLEVGISAYRITRWSKYLVTESLGGLKQLAVFPTLWSTFIAVAMLVFVNAIFLCVFVKYLNAQYFSYIVKYLNAQYFSYILICLFSSA